MDTETRHIFQRYPDKKVQIWRLMLKSSEFRTLCSDYEKCIEAGKYWDQSRDLNAKTKAEDYRYLCEELEKEVLQALQHSQKS